MLGKHDDFALFGFRYLPGWLMVGIMLVLSAWWVLPMDPDPEVAWTLHATALWLTDGSLYDTIATPQAPGVFLLTAVPALLAGQIGGDPSVLYAWFVYALALASLTLSALILQKGEIFCLRFGSAFLMTALAFIFMLAPLIAGNAMFRSEHLAVILTLPYLLAALPSVATPRASAITLPTGLLAAWGIMLSPGFLLLWLAIEVAYYVKERKLSLLTRPVNRITLVGILAWLLVTVLLFSDYWTRLLPLYLKSSPFSLLPSGSELEALKNMLIPLGLASLFFAVKPKGRWRGDILIGLLLVCAALVMGLLKPDAPLVRFYPALAMALLTIALLFLNFVYTEGEGREAFREGGGIAFSLGAMVVMSYHFAHSYWLHSTADEKQYMYWELADNIDAYAFDKEVFIFGDTLWPAFPLIPNTGGQWHARYSHLWPLSSIYVPGTLELQKGHTIRFHSKEDWQWEEIALLDALWIDFSTHEPFMMIFDESPNNYAGAYFFDYRAYFAQDDRYNALFAKFKRVHTVDMCEEFRLTRYCRYGIYHHSGL